MKTKVLLNGKKIGIEYSGRFSYFQMRLNDMIIWEEQPDFIYSPVNIDEASFKGYSLEASLQFAKRYSGSLDLTASHALDEQSGKILVYRPEFLATSSNTITFKRFSPVLRGDMRAGFIRLPTTPPASPRASLLTAMRAFHSCR